MLLNAFLHLCLAKRHLRVVCLVHLGEEEQQQTGNDQNGQNRCQDGTPRRCQTYAVLNGGMRRHKLTQRIGAYPCAGVVVLGAKLGCRKLLRLHDGGTSARAAGHAGVQRVECGVECIRRRLTCRSGRVIGARNGIGAGVVNGSVHAALLDSLGKLRRHQFIGLSNAICCRHGTGHHHGKENTNGQEHNQRNDIGAIGLLGQWGLAVIRLLLIGCLCHRLLVPYVLRSNQRTLFLSCFGLQHADA